MAKTLAFYGVNIIIGNYPVYYPPDSYVKEENENVFLFFSLGAFIGHNHKWLEALVALTNIVINKENRQISISSYNLIQTINNIAPPIQWNDYSVYKLSDYNDNFG